MDSTETKFQQSSQQLRISMKKTWNKVKDLKISKPKHANARPYKRDKNKNYEW